MKKIFLVAEREFMVRVKKKSFIIMTILVPFLLAASAMLPALVASMKSDKEKIIAVLDESEQFGSVLKDDGTVKFVPAEKSIDELKANLSSSGNYAILHIVKDTTQAAGNITIYSINPVGIDIVNIVTSQIKMLTAQAKLANYNLSAEQAQAILHPAINITTLVLDEQGKAQHSNAKALMALAVASGVVIFLIIFMFGIQVMRGVIEEKSNRIVEIIISSIKPMQLMMGKIIGVALTVLAQIFIWAVLFGAIMLVAQSRLGEGVWSVVQNSVQAVPLTQMLVCFGLYLTLGYLLYASLFAIIGAAVDNETDTQQLQMIAITPLMAGYFIMIAISMQPDHPLGFWGAMIPFTSPLVMLARIPFGVPLWEIGLSLAILAVTFVAFVWVAARIYRVGILMYGKKATLREIIKWARYAK